MNGKSNISRLLKNNLLLILSLLLILNACSAKKVIVHQPEKSTLPAEPTVLLAGAAEVDITPSPGYPLFGYSVEAEKHADGYWTRLKARAIAFEYFDQALKKRRRVALVQLDLGAVSALLHRKVAVLLAGAGFDPADLMIAGSHTHAAPGGFFGAGFYNIFGSGTWGYFPNLVDWLSERISICVKDACRDLKPAGISAGSIMVEGLSRNRSVDAWRLNFCGINGPFPYHEIIPEVFVLRVDHINLSHPGETTPIAVFVTAPVHATSVGSDNEFYHGDLHGAASRYLSSFIRSRYSLSRPFVAAVAAGPQGDVSPNWYTQGFSEAKRLGLLLAQKAGEVFDSLADEMKNTGPITVQHIYREIKIAGGRLDSGGSLCAAPMVGVPVMGGAEDGRSSLYGKFGIYEGRKQKEPKGCQREKVPALGKLQRIIKPKYFPRISAMQIIRFKDVLTFATIPAEPTTELGRRIREDLKKIVGPEDVAVISVADGYMSYVATPEEYAGQHFEGAFTQYGPNESLFFRENLRKITSSTKQAGIDEKSEFYKTRTFFPWKRRKVVKKSKACKPEEWRGVFTCFGRNKQGELEWVRFDWRGLKKKHFCPELPKIVVDNDGTPLRNRFGAAETDDWLNFKVRRYYKRHWSAVWTRPEGLTWAGKCRIKVSRPGLEPLISKEFSFKE